MAQSKDKQEQRGCSIDTRTFQVKIGNVRRVALPSEVCRSMSLRIGDVLVVRVDPEQLTLSSIQRTVERFQSMVGARVPLGYRAVDELIAERENATLRE